MDNSDSTTQSPDVESGSSETMNRTSKESSNEDEPNHASPNKYDPENPMPYFLAQEAKYIKEAAAKHKEMQEFRVADVGHTLSYQSICCWSLVTILLVGGSLLAVALTVDFKGTGDVVDLDNSTIVQVPP